MQSLDTVKEHVESPREDACAARVRPTLNGVGFARVGDSIGEQQAILPLQDVANEGKSCLGEKVRLGRVGWENVGKCVDGGRCYRGSAKPTGVGLRILRVGHPNGCIGERR